MNSEYIDSKSRWRLSTHLPGYHRCILSLYLSRSLARHLSLSLSLSPYLSHTSLALDE